MSGPVACDREAGGPEAGGAGADGVDPDGVASGPVAAADVTELYRRHAAAFAAARRGRFAERGWMDRFLAAVAPGGDILDVGCGSGDPVARYLAAAGHAVTGVDSSPELLAMFRRNLPGAAAHLMDMRRLALGRRFPGVLAWDSLFHLTADDQRRAIALLADHAAPGAALMFNSGPAAGVAIGRLQGDPLFHASLDPDAYRDLLDGLGFDTVAHVAEDPGCGGRTIWLFRRRDA